jgi:hypothetical protein
MADNIKHDGEDYPVEIHDSIKDATKERLMWGWEPVPLTKKHIDALLSGKVVKVFGGEYVQMVFLVEEGGDT